LRTSCAGGGRSHKRMIGCWLGLGTGISSRRWGLVLDHARPGEYFMPVRRSTFTRPLFAVAMVAASSLYAIAQQPPSPTRVRGTIEGVDGDVLAVKSRSGEDFKLHMASDMRLVGITKISLSDIKVGSFVGATTVPGPD